MKDFLQIVKGTEVPSSFYAQRSFAEDLSIVTQIIDDVRSSGDAAIHTYAKRFDRAAPTSLEIDKSRLVEAELRLKDVDPDLYESLKLSYNLAFEFALKQRESFSDFEVALSPGIVTGQKTIPVDRAGVYVPAGRFPLFSSVIMGSVPAKAAGVKEIVLCTPPAPLNGDASIPWADERILAVASLCGIDRVFAVGGAQAIAAMAYGTETIPKVDVIVGPGNKFVAEAKKRVYGQVGIDLVAGPTEVMIICDDSAHPDWMAADLLAQAEHDPDAQAILLTCSMEIAQSVQNRISVLLNDLPESAAARSSIGNNSMIIVVDDFNEAAEIANRKAPEHLEIAVSDGTERELLCEKVRNYGSLFIGHRSAEVLGDYAAGLNHTLPTSGAARFTGGLSVRHFLKTVTTLRVPEASVGSVDPNAFDGLIKSLRAAEQIAKAEGLSGHALAARCRLDSLI